MIQVPSIVWQLAPIFLYAETHYRFKYFFSFLRKKEPEILADAPHRLEPNTTLPILVLVKDAHLYPVALNGITLHIRAGNSIVHKMNLLNSTLEINQKLWWHIFEIPVTGLTGNIECDVLFELNDGRQKRFYHNDNYKTSSRKNLNVSISPTPLPRFKNLNFGECHSHSSYTDDQVEYGSPLGASVRLGKSLGLSFFCATDHSYDLDDEVDNYLLNDPNLPKWKSFQKEVDELNSAHDDFAVIRGEEVTSRNSSGQNVHLLLLGNKNFINGKGDGAEQWLKTRSEHALGEIFDILESHSITYAAHPREPVSILQRLLLGRGKWQERDFDGDKLSGIQFANGQTSAGFNDGYRIWIKALLQGKHLFTMAGNDAHGNFNRFRQIGIPFLKIREMDRQLFGKMRTGVFLESISENGILQTLRSGKSIISDGPVVNLSVESSPFHLSSIGCSYAGTKHTILLEVRTSTEYGTIEYVKVFKGIIGGHETEILCEKKLGYEWDRKFFLEISEECYIRAESWTSPADAADRQAHFCMTNPVWFTVRDKHQRDK
ncbi:MAG: hypothetical protein EHM64_11910 [Ignavibacteriae bacterium]|nr:MAG: hypothetical protein EHM64_11910 [Ignavibacteriota bacterium]